MKRMLLAAATAATLAGALVSAPASAAVSVAIGEPGFFGRIDLGGGAPPPQVINTQPVIIGQPVYGQRAPIYLRVPPGYERDWGRHCAAYNACGQPVYFVKDDWYRNEYARHYHEHGDMRRNEYWREHDRRDERDRRR